MKDKNGTRQACSGAIAAAGLLAFATACANVSPAATTAGGGSIAAGFPLLSETYPGLFGDGAGSLLVVDETQPGTVVYYSYDEQGYAGWPATVSQFPNGAFAPYGYFGYPYRYRPYGTYPRDRRLDRGHATSIDGGWRSPAGCRPPCGSPREGSGFGLAVPPLFTGPPGRPGGRRAGGLPRIGPQPPAVGPQPPVVGPRSVGPPGWQGLRPR